jgi:hypothetical protein
MIKLMLKVYPELHQKFCKAMQPRESSHPLPNGKPDIKKPSESMKRDETSL